jgi:ATP sulfurylase
VETKSCYGTSSLEHPGTLMVATERGATYVGGNISGISTATRDFPCESPAEVRAKLPKDASVVVFQCRNPVHRCVCVYACVHVSVYVYVYVRVNVYAYACVYVYVCVSSIKKPCA